MISDRTRTRRTSLVLAFLTLGVTLLAGCAAEPQPEVQRDALEDVAENTAPPDAATEYSAQLHPEPMVDAQSCEEFLVITARGTGEPSDDQLLTPVASTIERARPGRVRTWDLDYPANAEIEEGGTRGVRLIIDTLNVQSAACPDQQFVLLGYSQGALVVGDALLDPEVRAVGETVGELTKEAAQRILAIVFFGDPRFVGSEPFNVGSYDPRINGVLPRPPGALDVFADRIRDYCVEDDFVCQGSLELTPDPHASYYSNGTPLDGAAWVITELPPLDDPQSRADREAQATETTQPAE